MELFAKGWTFFEIKKCDLGPKQREGVLYSAAKEDRTSEVVVRPLCACKR